MTAHPLPLPPDPSAPVWPGDDAPLAAQVDYVHALSPAQVAATWAAADETTTRQAVGAFIAALRILQADDDRADNAA